MIKTIKVKQSSWDVDHATLDKFIAAGLEAIHHSDDTIISLLQYDNVLFTHIKPEQCVYVCPSCFNIWSDHTRIALGVWQCPGDMSMANIDLNAGYYEG